MDSKREYSMFPTQQTVYPPPYVSTTVPMSTPQVTYFATAPQVNRPRDKLWFIIAKYYILIKNWIHFAVTSLLAAIVAIVGLAELISGQFDLFFGFLFLAALIGLVPLYYYKVPIQGAVDGLPTRLIIHGIICGVNVLSALVLLIASDGISTSTGDQRMDQLLKIYTRNLTSILFSQLVFGTCEVLACFSMANLFHKERRMIPQLAYNA